jgi:leucyl/phenylalanyl-tRNA--protein transferase
VKTITWLAASDPPDRFPPLDHALDEPPGLLAAGGDLAPERLLAAYRRGIFPWYSAGQPVLWWSPDPREVLFPAELHRSRSLARTLRSAGFAVRFDSAFEGVIDACAAPRAAGTGTWITAEMRTAYLALHRAGYAHSVEVWRDGTLAGGLYGVALGRVFFGESMFARARDASKVALVRLCERWAAQGGELIDCQLASAHLRRLGSRPIAREEFARRLRPADGPGVAGLWR